MLTLMVFPNLIFVLWVSSRTNKMSDETDQAALRALTLEDNALEHMRTDAVNVCDQLDALEELVQWACIDGHCNKKAESVTLADVYAAGEAKMDLLIQTDRVKRGTEERVAWIRHIRMQHVINGHRRIARILSKLDSKLLAELREGTPIMTMHEELAVQLAELNKAQCGVQ